MSVRLFVMALTTLTALIGTVTTYADGPDNTWQRWRWPWLNSQSYNVTQTVFGTASHDSGTQNEYAIDFDLPFWTFIGATAQGQVVDVSTNYMSTTGYGAYVVQAATTGASETRYILTAHMCHVSTSLYESKYQGQYIGRSGNSGYVFDNNGNPPPDNCNQSYFQGMHLHFMISTGSPPTSSNTWQFGQVVDTQVSSHSANSSYLPVGHSTVSNNAPPGVQSSLSEDTWLRDAYISRGGLNYGATKSLDLSTFTPCGTSTNWAHGCTLGVSTGIAQTFEGPTGSVQKALIRKSGSTSVYSVEGPMLYTYHFVGGILRFPTTNRSGSQQNFEGGYIVSTSSPCQTKAYSTSGTLLRTDSGVC